MPALIIPPNVAAEESTFDKITHQAQEIVSKITAPLFGQKDTECLAKNIYYESKNEPEEGKVAVGLVTINRFQDDRYPKTICSVVNHRSVLGEAVVCQFSWTCTKAKNLKPREDDPLWQESLRIAKELAYGGYPEWQKKYANTFHFHAASVNPGWRLKKVARVGGHIFYQ